MHQKQCISLLLSGALFASLYTGCSQTTMEHHFFTDTVTETEINTEVVEQAITPKIEELQKILGDIKLEVFLQSDGAAGYVPGTGMSEEVKQRLFETFFTTKPTGLGTGLGMYITRNIIEEKHHGRIEFDSEEGKFTTFSLIIPMKE